MQFDISIFKTVLNTLNNKYRCTYSDYRQSRLVEIKERPVQYFKIISLDLNNTLNQGMKTNLFEIKKINQEQVQILFPTTDDNERWLTSENYMVLYIKCSFSKYESYLSQNQVVGTH